MLKSNWLTRLSIKQLTVLGFTLVSLPLVISLLCTAVKINHLSSEGSKAIFDVAQLTKTNRELHATRIKLERFASQYLVLNDADLLQQYLQQSKKMTTILHVYKSGNSKLKLSELAHKFLSQNTKIEQLITRDNQKASLENVQRHFLFLSSINEQINQQSNKLISQHASQIKTSAEQIGYILLQSTIVIPVAISIAILFIQLITKPLKQLTHKIQLIEHGKLTQKMSVKGSLEVTEIADALENMRIRLHTLELQKSSFIRHISHELKTPLAVIREGTELLYDHSVGHLNPEQQEISEIIRTSTFKLQTLIEGLLDFNVVLDSTSLQKTQRLSISKEVSTVLNTHKLDIKRKNIVIENQVSNIELYSNAKQLSIIIDNLLSNAIKYSPCAGKIIIASGIRNDELFLSITDQGCGIPETQQEKVFDAFYQGTPPNGSTIKGSGLGLTIVKELVMRLGGNIVMASQTSAPSSTSISIVLPRNLLHTIS